MRKTGAREGVESVVESLKGKAKEAVGALKGDDKLKGEGAAQQEKADAKREVAAKEAEAETARAAVRAHEIEQSVHQQDDGR